MAKKSGQEALNRARSGRAGRKSGTNVQKNPILELGETAGGWLGGAARGVVEGVVGWSNSQARTFTNPYINAAGRAIGKNPNLPVSGKGEAISNTAWAAVDIVAPTAGRVVAKGVGKVINNPAVRRAISEYTPVLRKTMLDAVDAEWKLARATFQKEADAVTRRFNTEMTGTKRMLNQSQQNLAASEMRKRSYRSGFMDMYETYEPAYLDMIDQNDLSKLTRGKINSEILTNAKIYDLADDILGTAGPNRKMAEKYLKAKAEVVRESIKYLTPEQRQKALESQLGKSILRRQGPR